MVWSFPVPTLRVETIPETPWGLKVKSWLVSHIGVFGPPFCILLIKTPNQIQGRLLSVFSVWVCCYDYDFWIILKSVFCMLMLQKILQNTSWGWWMESVYPIIYRVSGPSQVVSSFFWYLGLRSMSTAWGANGFLETVKLGPNCTRARLQVSCNLF